MAESNINDPPKPKAKCGRKMTSLPRIEELKERLLHGVSDLYLRQYAEKEWNIGPSRARRYIQHARKLIRFDAKPYTDDIFLDHLAIRRDLRKRANEANDLKLVLEIVKDEAALLALYDVKKKPVATESNSPQLPETTQVLLTEASRGMTQPTEPTAGT